MHELNMVPLESSRWSELKHAYGSASNVPNLLRAFARFPPKRDTESEPYFSLWSSLCHQGDVYTASYAAVPHIIEALAAAPARAPDDCFQLPACIEIARLTKHGPAIPSDLRKPYLMALARLPVLAAEAAVADWSDERTRVILSAIAATKGHSQLSEAILELEPEAARDFLESRFE